MFNLCLIMSDKKKQYIINIFKKICKNNISLIKITLVSADIGNQDFIIKNILDNIENIINKDRLGILNTNIDIIDKIINTYNLDINRLDIDSDSDKNTNDNDKNISTSDLNKSSIYSTIILYMDIVILSYLFIISNLIYLNMLNNGFLSEILNHQIKLNGNSFLIVVNLFITILNTYFNKIKIYEKDIDNLMTNVMEMKIYDESKDKLIEIIKEYEINLDNIFIKNEMFSLEIIKNVLDIIQKNNSYIINKVCLILFSQSSKYISDIENNNLNCIIKELIEENIINIKNNILK